MKNKIVTILFLSMLLTVSASAGAISINNMKISESNIVKADEFTFDVGDMTIDCYWDEIACEIGIPESPHHEINPQDTDVATINFFCDWSIVNQKASKNEKWYFRLVIKKGGGPNAPIVRDVDITVHDTLLGVGGPSQSEGTLSVEPIELGRGDFDKDSFHNVPETLRYRAELECEYYRGGIASDPDLLSEEDLWTVCRIDLANERPSTPMLTSDDISEGGTGDIDDMYSFTASGSTDPDGDSIIYTFDFHDGTLVDSVSGTASHKWEDEKGDHRVSVYAVDRFGRGSDGATMHFTLPRTKPSYYNILGQYPMLSRLLNNYILGALL